MTVIEYGAFKSPGGHEIYKQRVKSREIETMGGLKLSVAGVANGAGARGKRAAQLGLDSVFAFIANAKETNIPELLIQAVTHANQRVHSEYETNGGATSSLAIAAIENGRTLYVANVGDSRVYICRGDLLIQLTRDHTLAQEMAWRDETSATAKSLRAGELAREIGSRSDTQVDVGFYVNDDDYELAQERGLQGIPLLDGDSILVCSNSLTKPSHSNEPYATDEEIIRILSSQRGNSAAKSIGSLAVERRVDDNVSVAVLQTPRSAIVAAKTRNRGMLYGALGLLGLLSILTVVLLVGRRDTDQPADEQVVTLPTVTLAQLNSEGTLQARETLLAEEEAQQLAAQLTKEAAETRAALDAMTQQALTAEAIVQATLDAATRQAQISAAVAESEDADESADCSLPANFTFVTLDPVLDPPRGTISDASLIPSASFPIVVTGSCPINVGTLVSVKDGQDRRSTLLNENGNIVNSLSNGELGAIKIEFDSIEEVETLDDEWRITVLNENNDLIEFTPEQEPSTVKLMIDDAPGRQWFVQATPVPTATLPAATETQAVAVVPAATSVPRTAVPRTSVPTATRPPTLTPNYAATEERREANRIFALTETARANNANSLEQTRIANESNQRATRTAQSVRATQTVQAQGTAAVIWSATRTSQAQSATRTSQAQSATRTAQAQNAAATIWSATQTAEARRPTSTPFPTATPRPVIIPTNTPVPIPPTPTPALGFIELKSNSNNNPGVWNTNSDVKFEWRYTGSADASQFELIMLPGGQQSWFPVPVGADYQAVVPINSIGAGNIGVYQYKIQLTQNGTIVAESLIGRFEVRGDGGSSATPTPDR